MKQVIQEREYDDIRKLGGNLAEFINDCRRKGTERLNILVTVRSGIDPADKMKAWRGLGVKPDPTYDQETRDFMAKHDRQLAVNVPLDALNTVHADNDLSSFAFATDPENADATLRYDITGG